MKRVVVVTYNCHIKGGDSASSCTDVFEITNPIDCVSMWNSMMKAIEEKHPDIIPSTICILFMKELIYDLPLSENTENKEK
jgi:hypothetical protein